MNTKNRKINLRDISLDVVHKDIKNVHLSVYPPSGRVRIAAPSRMGMDTVRVFAISKLSWIKKQQNRFRRQEREAPRDYVTRESHYYLGRRYLLKVIEHDAAPKVELKHETIEMYVRPKTALEKKKKILDEWYRMRLKEVLPKMIARHEKIMKIEVRDFGIKKMKTKWGTCSREAKRIWLNLDLAKKPLQYIEYIVVHEMAHLLERRHNERFTAYMDQFLSQWRFCKDELNRSILSHAKWTWD